MMNHLTNANTIIIRGTTYNVTDVTTNESRSASFIGLKGPKGGSAILNVSEYGIELMTGLRGSLKMQVLRDSDVEVGS